MKIGMNLLLWTTDVDEKLFPIIEDLKETGFDGVEIPIGDEREENYDELGKKLKDLEMGCTCVTSIFEDGNPASADPSIRSKAVDQMKWRIDMGYKLGGPRFILWDLTIQLLPSLQVNLLLLKKESTAQK